VCIIIEILNCSRKDFVRVIRNYQMAGKNLRWKMMM
jgi:hypothetical protein